MDKYILMEVELIVLITLVIIKQVINTLVISYGYGAYTYITYG